MNEMNNGSTAAVADNAVYDRLLSSIGSRDARVGIVGLGYVGLPLAVTATNAGFGVIGFDIDAQRVAKVNRGETVIKHIDGGLLGDAIAKGKFEATADFSRLAEVDAILIAQCLG